MCSIVPQAIAPDNEGAYQRAIAAARRALSEAAALAVGVEGTFAAREQAGLAAANAACGAVLTATRQATADAQPDRVRIDDVVYVRHHVGTVTYHSLCGPLAVRRATYREVGAHHGPTVVPLDLATGLIAGAPPRPRRSRGAGLCAGPRSARRGTDARRSPAAAVAQHPGTAREDAGHPHPCGGPTD